MKRATLITPAEAARLAGCSPKQLRELAKAGRLRFERIGGGHRRYPLGEIAALAACEARTRGMVEFAAIELLRTGRALTEIVRALKGLLTIDEVRTIRLQIDAKGAWHREGKSICEKDGGREGDS